jgi:hypothetical protein
MVESPGLDAVIRPESVVSHPDDVELFWYHAQHCLFIWCFVKPAEERGQRCCFNACRWVALLG